MPLLARLRALAPWLLDVPAIVAVVMLLVAVVMYRLVIGVVRWVALVVLLAVVRAAFGWLRRRLPRPS